MRILLWHGWLLEGTGSNIYTAKVAGVWRRQGHEVVVMCQQGPSPRLGLVDAWGTAGPKGVSGVDGGTGEASGGAGPGSLVVVRPLIGRLLPVFVLDEYEGFDARRFVDLDDDELTAYLDRNVEAVSAVASWRPPDVTVAGHVMPGPVVARRALGPGTYVAKVHGSDLEYAVRLQERFAALAREGLETAIAVAGASADVLARAEAVVPGISGRTMVISPGVDAERWRPRERADALVDVADRLDAGQESSGGREASTDARVRAALGERDGEALNGLAGSYDQAVPDRDAASRLRALAGHRGPIVGYVGKLIAEKGVERYVEALAMLGRDAQGLVVGFGGFREWIAALVAALDDGDLAAHGWLSEASTMQLELERDEVGAAAGLARRTTFTGRLDHQHAPEALSAMDVLVVPSTLPEAFGMVAAEAAAAGVPPLVARHSSLAEVAEALEGAVGEPGLLSFEPGPGATHRLTAGLRRLLELSPDDRRQLGAALRDHVVREWTWERTAGRLLEAAGPR